MFVEPMYACPLPNLVKNPRAKPVDLESGMWVAEEKFDGIRLVTEVSQERDKLFVEKGVTSWSRYGNVRNVPEHIQEQLAKLPDCIIDGELMAPGKRSYGSMDLDNAPDLIYYVFDILQFHNGDVQILPYNERRRLLSGMLATCGVTGSVCLAASTRVESWEDVYALRDKVWARDGEGLILKRVNTPYTTGKRPKQTWIKIKQLLSEVFTVIGFTPSRGEIVDRGPFGMTKLRGPDGNITAVKTRNNVELKKLEDEWESHRQRKPFNELHPAIGRKLRCEYQERTPDGEYRHIRWDRWEDE